MTDSRLKQIVDAVTRIDGQAPSSSLSKHAKMATSPFVFYRGSAQLFYADIKASLIDIPSECSSTPLTSIMGDCHTSNFGFLTEEGSHGDTVIFSPNDFDDACVGKAEWDVLRYLTSLHLAKQHCAGVIEGVYACDEINTAKPVVSHQHVIAAQFAFLDRYIDTCNRVVENALVLNEAVNYNPNATPSRLTKLYKKRQPEAQAEKNSLQKARWQKRFTSTVKPLRLKPTKISTLN